MFFLALPRNDCFFFKISLMFILLTPISSSKSLGMAWEQIRWPWSLQSSFLKTFCVILFARGRHFIFSREGDVGLYSTNRPFGWTKTVGLRSTENSGLQNIDYTAKPSVNDFPVGLQRIPDYREVGLCRFHCITEVYVTNSANCILGYQNGRNFTRHRLTGN